MRSLLLFLVLVCVGAHAQYTQNFNTPGCAQSTLEGNCFGFPSPSSGTNVTSSSPIEGTCSATTGPLNTTRTFTSPGLWYNGTGSVQVQFAYKAVNPGPVTPVTLVIKLVNPANNMTLNTCTINTDNDPAFGGTSSCSFVPTMATNLKVVIDVTGSDMNASMLIDNLSVSNVGVVQGPGGLGGCTALPVQLKSFSAKLDECTVRLDWVTTQEYNADYFSVQRSTDGFEFGEIARIAAAGTTTQQREYSFVDTKPELRNYYRLKQVDFDGTLDLSRLLYVADPCWGERVTMQQPKSREILLRAESVETANESLTAVLMSLQGTTLRRASLARNATLRIDASDLPTGVYFVQVYNEHGYALLQQKVLIH
jgi:hypothetical protein